MKTLIKNIEDSLQEMTDTLDKQMAEREAMVEEALKDHPEELLRYKNAIFKLDEWIKNHRHDFWRNRPDAEFFLR